MWDSRIFYYIDSVTGFINLNEGNITDIQITYDSNRNFYVVFFNVINDSPVWDFREEIYRDDD